MLMALKNLLMMARVEREFRSQGFHLNPIFVPSNISFIHMSIIFIVNYAHS